MGAAVVVRVRVKAILCVIVDGVPNALRRFHVPVHVRNMHAYTSVVNPWIWPGWPQMSHLATPAPQ